MKTETITCNCCSKDISNEQESILYKEELIDNVAIKFNIVLGKDNKLDICKECLVRAVKRAFSLLG